MDITFKDVSYVYQENTPFAHKALNSISLHIPSGSFVAIIGPTGSGKSTLLQHLNGLIRPTQGEVTIGDFHLKPDDKPKNMKQLRSQVGVVFQYPEHQLFEETVEKDIAFGPTNFGVSEPEIKRRTREAISTVGLPETTLERSPFDLSGGQMRRVAIAGVLAVNPNILVLDEPTAGLDPRGQKEMMAMFYERHQQQQLTTILVTHSMEDAVNYADNVFILNQGEKYLEGRPEAVLSRQDDLKAVQLDVPEMVQLIKQLNKQFNLSIPFTRQSIQQLAKQIQAGLGGPSS